MASRHSSSRSASCGQGELRWHGVQEHILVHDADRRRRVGSAVRLRPLVAQTAHPRCPWVTPPVAVSDPNSFEDGALGPLESDAERGMERGEQEPMNALRCICVNDLQDIHIGNRDYVDVAAAQLLDLSLFRQAPHAFKPHIYHDGLWFFQQRIASRRGPEATAAQPFGDAAFLREFSNGITRGDDTPVYTLLHVITPHLPVVTDADCAYAPKRAPIPEDFANQARCALSAVRTLLDRLRDLDLYDRSAIIVTSDHGLTLDLITPEDEHPLRGLRSPAGVTLPRIESWATPLLLVKPFAAEGPLQTSYAPTSITDVPATLLDLADLPDTLERGASVLRIDPVEPRQRTYAHHNPNVRPNPFYDVLYVFAVNGQITDPEAWSYYRSVFGPADDRAAQRREHQIGLVADPDVTANQFGTRVYRTDELRGLLRGGRGLTWLHSMSAGCRPWPPPRRLTVRIDGAHRRPTRTRGRRVAHAVLSGRGAVRRQPILHRITDKSCLVRRNGRVLGPNASGRHLRRLSIRQPRYGGAVHRKARSVERDRVCEALHGIPRTISGAT